MEGYYVIEIPKMNMEMDYKPLFDKILITTISSEQNFGGLIIPDTSTTLKKGIVIAVGEGKIGKPMTVKIGQTVFFEQSDLTSFLLEGVQYYILNETSVWISN